MKEGEICIDRIISEERLNRTVRVSLDISYYGGTKTVNCGFFRHEWLGYKAKRTFPENRALGDEEITYFESLSKDKWYQLRFAAKLEDFTDEEIVAEANRRLMSFSHGVILQGKLAIRHR